MNAGIVTLYELRGRQNRKRHAGIPKDLARRLAEHRSGTSKGGQLLGTFEVILTGNHPDYSAARQREIFLKSGQGRRWLDEAYGK